MMLKISEAQGQGHATLYVAGRLAGEWIGELNKACEKARTQCGRVVLDFADVVFVDRAGAALIRSLTDRGISLVNCSPFVNEQLKQL